MSFWPRSIGSRVYLALLSAVVLGLILVVVGPWRAGVGVVGASFLAAALMRAIVPADHVGMLKVRGMIFDVVWMTTLGVSLVVLAVVIPNQPPL